MLPAHSALAQPQPWLFRLGWMLGLAAAASSCRQLGYSQSLCCSKAQLRSNDTWEHLQGMEGLLCRKQLQPQGLQQPGKRVFLSGVGAEYSVDYG